MKEGSQGVAAATCNFCHLSAHTPQLFQAAWLPPPKLPGGQPRLAAPEPLGWERWGEQEGERNLPLCSGLISCLDGCFHAPPVSCFP